MFLALGFLDVKLPLLIMIAFSTRVIYFHGSLSAMMMTALVLMFVSVCLFFYFRFCLNQFEIKKTNLNLPMAVFLGLASIQAIRGLLLSNPVKWVGTEYVAYLGFGSVFFMITIWDSEETIKKFFQFLVVVAYYHALVGLWNYFQVGHRIGGYLFGTFPSLIALVLLNLSFYARERSQKAKYILLALPLVLHLVFSFTRGYWLGFLVALLFSYGICIANSDQPFRHRALRFVGGVGLSIAAFVMVMFISQAFLPGVSVFSQISHRFKSSFSTKFSPETGSNVARLIEYKVSWNKIKESPILGHGVGSTFNIINPARHRRFEEWGIHQFYMMITMKMGLIGLFSFLWIYYVFFREGLRGSRMIEDSYSKGLAYGFMANSVEQLVISFTNHQFATVDNNFYLAFTMAGVMVLISRGTRGQTWTYQSS
ncbi:MAG: O-antigen ligase family protein [Candidatus Zixiibacteriota bacterium]